MNRTGSNHVTVIDTRRPQLALRIRCLTITHCNRCSVLAEIIMTSTWTTTHHERVRNLLTSLRLDLAYESSTVSVKEPDSARLRFGNRRYICIRIVLTPLF